MSDQYRTIVGIAHASYVVKKSRFLGEASAIHTQEAVKDFLSQENALEPFQVQLQGLGIVQ